MYLTLRSSIVALFVFASAVVAEDQKITPDFVQVTTPVYRAYESGFTPAMGRYTYEVSWNGIPAAEGTVDVGGDSLNYRIVASAHTYSVIDILYKLRYRAEGIISAVDMSPIRTVISQQENSKVKNWDIKFQSDGEIESVKSQKGKPDEVIRFNSNNFTLDPIAAAFLARGLEWQEGETKQFDTFNGKTRYLISLTASGKETVRYNGESRDCWVISPKVTKIATDEPQHKLREAKIYLSDDKDRDIIKIVSSVFIGSVTTKLISFEPSGLPSPVRMAQLRSKSFIK